MSYQYRTCTRGDYKSSGVHDWLTRKNKTMHRFKIENSKFDDSYDPSIFSDWLADIERYFD